MLINTLYNQKLAEFKNNLVVTNSSTEPVTSLTEGRIYYNSTDKHFYGYNGTEWKQLDN